MSASALTCAIFMFMDWSTETTTAAAAATATFLGPSVYSRMMATCGAPPTCA